MYLLELFRAGVDALKDYIALHIVTCLIPAFLLAGAMVSFVSKETIIHYLGAAANKAESFCHSRRREFLCSGMLLYGHPGFRRLVLQRSWNWHVSYLGGRPHIWRVYTGATGNICWLVYREFHLFLRQVRIKKSENTC